MKAPVALSGGKQPGRSQGETFSRSEPKGRRAFSTTAGVQDPSSVTFLPNTILPPPMRFTRACIHGGTIDG
jgi:hypothetical protein